jgi:hypothetical protein
MNVLTVEQAIAILQSLPKDLPVFTHNHVTNIYTPMQFAGQWVFEIAELKTSNPDYDGAMYVDSDRAAKCCPHFKAVVL